MAVASGLGGSFGASKETVYGTSVAPAKFLETLSMAFARKPTFIQGGGLSAGRFVHPSSRNAIATTQSEATVQMEIPSKGFGFLLENLLGTTGTSVQQGASAAYLQTFTLGDNLGKSLTTQFGVPQTDGTLKSYTLLGSKITSMELSCGVGEVATANISFDAQDTSEAIAYATPSYSTGVHVRTFMEMNVKTGTYGSETAVDGIRKVTLKIDRPMKTDRFYANGGGKKSEPIVNDWHSITGTVETDFTPGSKTAFADLVVGTATTSFVWEFVGPIIASTYKETFRVTMSATAFQQGDPNVTGPDVVNPTYNFVVMDDQTNNPVKIEYITTDVTI